MSSTIAFQYTTAGNLTTASAVLRADDLVPASVVRMATVPDTWVVAYTKDAVLAKASRVNALYNIFCSPTQYTAYNQDTFTQLRVDFCVQPESYPDYYCPDIADYNKLGGQKSCSRLYSKNPDFNNDSISNRVQCSALTRHLDVRDTDETMKAAVQNGYKRLCDANPTMKECQCYNRAKFTSYKDAVAVLSSGGVMQSGNESCWYVPCLYQTNITVDPDIQKAYDRVQCPDVCQNIVAAINVNTAVFSNINLNNQCVGAQAGNVVEDISKDVKKTEVGAQFEAATQQQVATIKPQAIANVGVVVGGMVFFAVLMISLIVYLASPPAKASGRRS